MKYSQKLTRPRVVDYCEFYFYRFGELVSLEDINLNIRDSVFLTRQNIPKISELVNAHLVQQNIIYQIKFDLSQYEIDKLKYDEEFTSIQNQIKQDIFNEFGFLLANTLANKIYDSIGFHEYEYIRNEFSTQYMNILNDQFNLR